MSNCCIHRGLQRGNEVWAASLKKTNRSSQTEVERKRPSKLFDHEEVTEAPTLARCHIMVGTQWVFNEPTI